MASEGSSCCCPPNSLTYLDAGSDASRNLTGRCISISSESCGSPCEFYLAAPGTDLESFGTATDRAIILIPDVWGWNSGTIRNVAEHFKGQGYAALIPKVLLPALEGGTDGDALPPNFDMKTRGADFMAYIKTITWAIIKPTLQCAISFLKSRGIKKIGMIGFCFGGWVCANATADPDTYPDISCFASPHPSLILEEKVRFYDYFLLSHVNQIPFIYVNFIF